MSSLQGQLLAKLRHDAEQVIYQQKGHHSLLSEWSEVDPEFREVEALTMDEVLKSNLLDRKYNELVALIWHKIGNGEDGATPIEKLISDFSDEHYKLFDKLRNLELDLTEKLDRAERALKRAGYQDLGAQEWKPPLGLSVQAIRNAWLDAEVVGNSWDGAKAVLDLYRSVKRSVDEKCPKCFDTGTIGGPAQACDCKREISTGKAFQMEPGAMSQDEALDVVMESVDQVEVLARVLREAHAKHYGGAPESYLIDGFMEQARAAIAHLSTRPEGLPTRDDIAKLIRGNAGSIPLDAPMIVRRASAVLDYLRPWLRDPVRFELDVSLDEMCDVYCNTYSGTCRDDWQAVLDLCRSRIRPVYECDCSAIKKERDLLKVECESRQIMINNVRAALEGKPFKNTLEGE